MTIADFFNLVRKSSSAVTWSRGVELSREGGVLVEKATPEEPVLRVTTPDRLVSATVTLLFDDEDWVCDCRSGESPCEHVAAAVIALKRAKEIGALPVSTVVRGVIIYAFFEREGDLQLERNIRVGQTETPLVGSLSAQVTGKAEGYVLSASKEDWAIDSLLRNQKPGTLPAPAVRELLTILGRSHQVTFDGKAVDVNALPVSPLVGLVTDEANGVRLVFHRNLDLVKQFHNGAALGDDALRPMADPDWTPAERAMVHDGRLFAPEEYAVLVSDLLPKLQQKIKVEVHSRQLPQIDEDIRPRLFFQTVASGEILSVLPLIIYGNPPIARVDGDKLVFMGELKKVPLRQVRLEKSIAAALYSDMGLTAGRRVDFRGDAAIRFNHQLNDSRYEVSGKGKEYFGTKARLVPDISFKGGNISVTFSSDDGGAADPMRVIQAWKEGASKVSLDEGGGWAPIPTAWLEQYGHRVLAFLESKDADGKVAVFHRPEAARFCEEIGIDVPPDFARLRKQLETFSGISAATLPRGFTAVLRPYQKSGVDWLNFLRDSGLGALLADDMGLGKSVQTIAVLTGRTLIIAPTSVMTNWQKELHRFRPGLSVSIYHGSQRELDRKADVVVTTYSILRLDRERLAEIEWDCVVVDEAQYIKNADSQSARSACSLRAKFRVALTGTPIENRPEDLWSLFNFLNPGLLGTRTSFQKSYWTNDAARIKELRLKIKPFVLRRLKQDVAPELPPRTETVLYSELSPEEQLHYDTVKAATQKAVLEQLGVERNVMAVLESLLRLRQAACHSALLPGVVAHESSKVSLLLEKLEEIVGEDHKALVFSQWTSMLDLIEPELKKSNIRFSRIDGSTTDRQPIIDDFQSAGGPPVLLMTLRAGGVGLNLTAADHVFLVDPWWNPAAEDQAADRAHRIGQTRPVFIHRLVTRGTVEEKILALQESKRATAEKVLSGSDHAVSITREDLLNLLN
jgi:hypothetical protein